MTDEGLLEATIVATLVNGGSGSSVKANDPIGAPFAVTVTLPVAADGGTTASANVAARETILARVVPPPLLGNAIDSDAESRPSPVTITCAPRGADEGTRSAHNAGFRTTQMNARTILRSMVSPVGKE